MQGNNIRLSTADKLFRLMRNIPVAVKANGGVRPLLRKALNKYRATGLKGLGQASIGFHRPLTASPAPVAVTEMSLRIAYADACGRAASLSNEYVHYQQHAPATTDIRAIAYYLPQFHPVPENDEWWGKGFTEWTNVSKAVPQFLGHYQPHLPADLGFYDLRLRDIQQQQIKMARNYGISGFCYHYYWFNGRRLLERPLNQVLADASLDFPFCICWANENWTRRWDGAEEDVLLAQTYTPESDLAFIRDLIPLLRDPRYIRVTGRPLVVVYRINLLPDPAATAKIWRDCCIAEGVGDPYLVVAQSFGITDPRPFGFDAAVEFPPHGISAGRINERLELLNDQYTGSVFDYRDIVNAQSRFQWPDYPLFRCVMPSWDNEARRPGRGNTFAYSSPAAYRQWLSAVVRQTASRPAAERFVFINAWNEWAEGAHLEPCRKYGYAFLQATHDALNERGETA